MARSLRLPLLGLAVVLVLLLAATSAAARPTAYRIAQASFDVQEEGSWKSDYKASWEGSGHRHERRQADDDELPPLPIALFARGGTITAATDLITDGDETSIDAEGKKEACSGVWGDERHSTFSVKIKPVGEGQLQSTWEVDTGISSENCGAQFNHFPSLKVKVNSAGKIGNRRIVLQTSGTKTKTIPGGRGTEKQTVKWKATLILVKFQVTTPKLPHQPHR